MVSASPSSIDLGQNLTLSMTTPFSGGTSPYTCEWMQVPPGHLIGNLSDSFSCTPSSPISTSALPNMTGVWRYYLEVTDNLSQTALGRAANPTVSPSLSLSPPSLTVTIGTAAPTAATAIDTGQSVNVTVAWTGGTSTYTVSIYTSSSSSCNFASLPRTAPPLRTSPYTFKGLPALTSNTWFCAAVTDSSIPQVTRQSSSVGVVVNSPALQAPTIHASTSALDYSRRLNLTTLVGLSGGTGPYSCQWLQKSPTATKFIVLGPRFACTGSQLPTTLSGTLRIVGVWTFQVTVTDGSARPVSVTSAPVTTTVQPRLVGPRIIVSATTLSVGQSADLSMTAPMSGGTSVPYYNCQWLQKSPASLVYVPLGVSFHCSVLTMPTAATGSLSTLGLWRFRIIVNDSASPPMAVLSNILTVRVSPPLGTPTVSPALTTVDSGQGVSVKVTWTGGIARFTVKLYLSNSSSCSNGSSLQATLAGVSSSPRTFAPHGSLTSGVWYCATVSDSSPSPVTTLSSAVHVTVNAPPHAPVISVNYAKLDYGQSTPIFTSAPFSGGTPTYTCQWLRKLPTGSAFGAFGLPFSCSASFLSTSSRPLTSLGAWFFELQVKDKAGVKVLSNAVNVTVGPALSPPSLLGGVITIHSGGTATISLASPFSGGTPSYTCQLVEGSSPGSLSPWGSPQSCTPSMTSMSTGVLVSTGAYYFAVQVTDSSGVPVSVRSTQVEVIVQP